MTTPTEHHASPIDWQSEAKYLRELIRERNARITELELALAETVKELSHWHSALNHQPESTPAPAKPVTIGGPGCDVDLTQWNTSKAIDWGKVFGSLKTIR